MTLHWALPKYGWSLCLHFVSWQKQSDKTHTLTFEFQHISVKMKYERLHLYVCIFVSCIFILWMLWYLMWLHYITCLSVKKHLQYRNVKAPRAFLDHFPVLLPFIYLFVVFILYFLFQWYVQHIVLQYSYVLTCLSNDQEVIWSCRKSQSHSQSATYTVAVFPDHILGE